jgi:hypothetical protein
MPLLPIDKLTFYLPFPDGVLQYVCAECDAHCCQGYSFGGSLAREMTTLFTHYPALETAVTSRRGDVVWMQNNERCPFLLDNNFCRIERDLGKKLKPGVCGLFPFNKFSRLSEDIIVVSPHFLCPLRVRLPRDPASEGSHQKIIEAVKESALLDSALFASNISPAKMASRQSPMQALQQEISFRDQCSAALEKRRFFEVVAGGEVEALSRFVRRAALVCGVAYAPRVTRDSLDDLLLTLAPIWRVEMIHLGPTRMSRVLALAEVLLRRLTTLAERAPSPKQVYRMYTDIFPALQLLSLDDEPMLLPKALQKVPPLGSAKLTFAAFHALRGAEKRLLVGFEEAFAPDLAVSDRMAILLELGAHTQGVVQKTKR